MARQQGWVAFILVLAIASGVMLATYGLQLGLDLRGGSQLTLQVMPAGTILKVESEQLEAVKDVLERRINGLGVAESTLQTIGSDQLMLQLPAPPQRRPQQMLQRLQQMHRKQPQMQLPLPHSK